MDKCYDQRIEEHYTEHDSQRHLAEESMPYNPLRPQSNQGLVKKVLITDEICDDENFEDDDRGSSGLSSFSKN
jgi:hypothetical protein